MQARTAVKIMPLKSQNVRQSLSEGFFRAAAKA